MELEHVVKLSKVTSHEIFSILNSAVNGRLKEKWDTEDGKKEIQGIVEKDLLRIANEGFRKGREFQAKVARSDALEAEREKKGEKCF